jgi:bacillithiol biosynthesis cysteine-adding enzyme BshC
MEFAPIPYTQLPKTSALFLDYLYHFDRVAQFYNGSPFDPTSYKTLAGQVHLDANKRAELVKILTQQNEAFGCSEATSANIKRLSDPGTFAVVTGQQVGLLSGPAFTLYKALTAVRLAHSLSEQRLPTVPVFWLATEDHDLDEVAQTAILDEEYNLVELKDAGKRPASQSPVGYVKLTAEINVALDQIEKKLPSGAGRDQVLRDLHECYQPGVTWGRAFALMIAKLFSRWGVILLDPLNEAIHRLSVPIYDRVITETGNLRSRLIGRSKALVGAGYHAQVHVGEDTTLLFVSRDGNRTALHERNGKFSFGGAETASAADLRDRARNQPLNYSANALLRPFIQDTLLPTIAYIAGPSELAYLAESQVIYKELGVPQPIIFPRAAFTLVDSRTQRLMEKYQVRVDDVWQGGEHLKRTIAANGFAPGWSARLDETERGLADLLERLRKDVTAIDSTLLDTLKNTEEKMKHQIDALKGKITRAALEKSELLARHEQALLGFLLPRKQLQEREVSGVYFLARAGYDLLDRLLAQIRTDSSDHQVVVY